MAESNPSYDPGFLNSPGKGQSAANPLAPTYVESLGVVSDLSVYQNVYGRTLNASVGFTLGLSGAFTASGFFVQPPGVFEKDVSFQSDAVFQTDISVGRYVFVQGIRFVPTFVRGTLVLAAG